MISQSHHSFYECFVLLTKQEVLLESYLRQREDNMEDFVADEDVFWSLKIEVLHDMRDELAKNLYPDKFFAYFRSKRIFDADDCDSINAERTRRKQAELFLDILESKGPEAFDEFCRFINKNKTQIYLLQKILDKFEQKKGEILEDHSRRFSPSDLDLDDKTPATTTPTTVLMPPSFNPITLPGPPTPPDEVPSICGVVTDDDATSTTTLTGNSVSQPSSADATYPGPTPPPYTVPAPNDPPPPYTE